ncbi:hypothetical protein BASA81_014392 [Batrachochytrium salamandrivorans]|nr:hypothetical protein BASA81_014392 [Batrachochytrium salamandrivorans]
MLSRFFQRTLQSPMRPLGLTSRCSASIQSSQRYAGHPHYEQQRRHQSTETEAAARVASPPHSSIAVGILLKRNPMVLPDLSEFQHAYYAYREAIERNEAAPFDHTFYFKKGSISEQRWLAAQAEAAALVRSPNNGDKTTLPDLVSNIIVQPQDDELIKLTVAPKLSSADASGDVKSLDRAMQRSLYLVVKQNTFATTASTNGTADTQWQLPTGDLFETETLHEAAPARLSELCGDLMDTWFVGKAPVGHIKAVDTKGTQKTKKSIFYMKAHILSGKITPSDDVIDYAWMTKEELVKQMDPEYYAHVSDMLSDL